MSQADRIILLEELFLNTKNHKLRINSVKKAYEKNNISLSDKTIYEDLKLIATCDKRDNNNWVLNSTTKINKQKKELIRTLRSFSIYHPVVFATPLDIESVDYLNKRIQLFSIYLELKPKKPLYLLEKIIIDLKKYYKLQNQDLYEYIWDYHINNRHLQLTFNDKESVIELFSLLVDFSNN